MPSVLSYAREQRDADKFGVLLLRTTYVGCLFDESFSKVWESKKVDFLECSFVDCEFKCDFGESVSFALSRFHNTTFQGVALNGKETIFAHTTMTGDGPHFVKTKFYGEVTSFVYSHLEAKRAVFHECSIHSQRALFIGASVNSDTFFICVDNSGKLEEEPTYTIFSGEELALTGIRVNGHFEYYQDPANKDHRCELTLVGTNFGAMKSATFLNANFTRTRMMLSSLESARFICPRWPVKGWWKKRIYVFDEDKLSPGTGLIEVANTYVQLKKNYDENRKYAESGHWFYREMDCRKRLLAPPGWNPLLRFMQSIESKFLAGVVRHLLLWPYKQAYQRFFTWNGWYRRISGYGESWILPVFWLAVVLLVGARAHYLWGDWTYCMHNPAIISQSLEYSVLSMAFQLKHVHPDYPKAAFWIAFGQQLLTLILLPLFILALRRRFKR